VQVIHRTVDLCVEGVMKDFESGPVELSRDVQERPLTSSTYIEATYLKLHIYRV
jgi:hypothetical protein